jgi:hypothetical protein
MWFIYHLFLALLPFGSFRGLFLFSSCGLFFSLKMEAEGFSETLGDDIFVRYTVLYPGRE